MEGPTLCQRGARARRAGPAEKRTRFLAHACEAAACVHRLLLAAGCRMEAALVVLFAPAALIAASALGLHQFFALWRVFATAVNTRSGSPAWKTVQPGASPARRAHSFASR